MSTHNLSFWAKIRKRIHNHSKPHFSLYKVCFFFQGFQYTDLYMANQVRLGWSLKSFFGSISIRVRLKIKAWV